MTINIKNQTIFSIDFSDYETAWKIEDATLVLEYLKSENKLVLGGDILNERLNHTYDSWYYNPHPDRNTKTNINCSIEYANEYLKRYIKENGVSFHVIFVTQD